MPHVFRLFYLLGFLIGNIDIVLERDCPEDLKKMINHKIKAIRVIYRIISSVALIIYNKIQRYIL